MTANYDWYLDGYVDGERLPRRIPITRLPFRIGRGDDVDGRLPLDHVSVLHAEIYENDGELWLRDHNSSNGTFVNRRRVRNDVPLSDGDIIHISTNEFVLRQEEEINPDHADTMCLAMPESKLPERLMSGTQELKELLKRGQVVPHFQPVVQFGADVVTVGFEILGRGTHDGLPQSPGQLFQIAESAGLEVMLSELFRRRGLKAGRELPGSPLLFVNSHPSEIGSVTLINSLREIRKRFAEIRIVLETHEAAVQSASSMRELRAQLTDLDIGLAYDDFGAGQARLLELVEVPPDFLKFDISLIRDIDRGPLPRQKMLRSLTSMVNDMGIACLAEGI